MKNLFLLLLACINCLWLQAVERIAPIFPDFVELESGKDYYLYNTGREKFLTSNGTSSYAYIGETGVRTNILLEEGFYKIKFIFNQKYLYRNSNSLYINESFNKNYCYWDIRKTDNQTYTIQTPLGKSYYNENQYVGNNTNNDDTKVYPNLSNDNNIEWKFIDGDAGDMYYARLRLYDALEAMDGKEYNIEKFEEIYANTNSTIEEINNAADILNNANTITSNYNFPEWNDYPILFESSPDKKWNANSDRIECSGLESGTSTLTATVVTNNDATLCYELNGGENSRS